MKKLIGLTILGAFLSWGTQAQSHLSQNEVNSLVQLKFDLEGTYQIQMIDTRTLPSVELTMFRTISELRDPEEIVYHTVSENMRIKILPNKEIEKAGFVPLDYYTFISSKEIE